ncbi:MAG: RagB/SusD family nutrient uptake outer membrane protein, partial [Prevotellaceae bacterium]|nr:RagB/SusD family nutrient uptake outer membrane protein [Prevotellaceae bacterium]
MKHNYYLIWLIILSGIVLSSCSENSFLDETATTDLTTDVIFSDSTYTVGFLSEIYREIGFDTDPGRFKEILERFGGLQGACDEVECKISAKIKTDMLFATGSVNPVIVSEDAWEKCWQNIRRVNIFLQNVDKAPLGDRFKKTYKAEARFLRAWYYFILLKHYGGVPLIGDVVYEADDEIKTERNTFAECVDYILSECDAIMTPEWTIRPSGRDYGRAGTGACLGLKSRVLLYAASPLFNGGAEVPAGYPKELVAYPEYQKERWKEAMDAARAVIDLNVYALYDVPLTPSDNDYPYINGYFWIFQASDRASDGAQKEHLVEQQVPKSHYRESLFCPPSRGGNGGGFAYQELIDCYPMLDGTPYRYTPEEEQAGQNPWGNRDPRLYMSITYDQHLLNEGAMNFKGIVNTYLTEDGKPFDQDAVHTGTPTGYYICKMQHFYAAAGNGFIDPPQSRPQLRYAEILLNYAEAATEWNAPADPPTNAYEALKLIRKRAGIQAGANDMYGLKDDMTAAEMREIIRNERRIELAFEGHRFFDVRRWMIAPQTDSKMMTGMEVQLKSGK